MTHFDVFDNSGKTRLEQAKELITAIQKNKNPNILIAADFNSVRSKDYQYSVGGENVWDLLKADNLVRNDPTPTDLLEFIEAKNFKDSFTFANLKSPKFTTWNGTTIDFIYLSKDWSLPVNAYVFYSSASDHLPVIVDVKN